MTRRVRLAEVAAHAGVSVSAVSLVMTGKDAGNIAPATRDRILASARELDYRPNSVAQSLRKQRSHAVGLVTDAIATSPFAGRIIGGAMDTAAERGYVLLLFDSQDRREEEAEGMAELARRQVDGFLYATMSLVELATPPPTTLPLVLANCYVGGEPTGGVAVPAVIPDDLEGGRAAAEHLLALGHRRIVMLSAPGAGRRSGPGGFPIVGNASGPLRAQGFVAALTEAGVARPERAVRVCGWDIDDGYAGAMAVLAGADGQALPERERPSAIFAVTDRSAAGVSLAAARLGRDVPRDLSVVGFDDQEALAERLSPPLTTCALPHRAMGEVAMSWLLDGLATGGSRREIVARDAVHRLACPLIVRSSTAAAPTP